MSAIRDVAFALLGLAFGSFLTVVVSRVPERRSIVAPRSACPRCGARIRARDNVPVVSYLLLRGRCRDCQTRISAEYPIIEALTGALFVAAAVAFRRTDVAGMVAVFLAVVMGCAVIDLRHRIIPNAVVYPSLALFAAAIGVLVLLGRGLSVTTAIFGFLAFGGGLFAIALVSPSGMGMGDVKLGAFIGLVLGSLGWAYVGVAALAAVLLGGVGAIAALASGRSRKDTIPFGPYLAAGAVLSALVAPQLSFWYLAIFP